MTYGHHQAERDKPRNALRGGALAKRLLSGGDNWPCARGPRSDE